MGCRFRLGVLRNISTTVAGGTLRLAGVVHRGRRPGRVIVACSMASIASPGSRNVVGGLGERALAGVGPTMTGCAGFAGNRMVHPAWLEGAIARPVAVFAGTAGWNVDRGLALGIDTVVTIGAATENRWRCCSMVERTGGPGCEAVAISVAAIASCRRLDMGSRLGQCILGNIGAAVASRARRPASSSVVHRRWLERSIVVVTTAAIRRSRHRRNMPCRFAQRRHTVTGIAPANRRRIMAVGRRSPRSGAPVTGVALSSRRDVGQRLLQRILRNIAATVTGRTLAVQAGVVHHRRRPGVKATCVASIALSACRDMDACLGQRIGKNKTAVVATATCSGRTGMAHGYRREGGKRVVTAIALPSRRNMVDRFAQCV